jgi:thiamine-monophosphate kinase
MHSDDTALGEFELIGRYFARAGQPLRREPGVVLGIGDDAAVLALPPQTELVVAVDTIVVGRHFLAGCDARSIGHRALAVNLSDLAAMGANPAWATLALTLPEADPAWLAGFSQGLLALADAHHVALVGGDTTAGPLTVSVQILGHVPRGAALRRSGAQAGDLLAVTGTLGDAGAGLEFARATRSHHDRAAVSELLQRFDFPTPRVQFGIAARGIANAAMDISDGLVGDLPKLAAASGLAAHIEVGALPLSRALREVAPLDQARNWALAAGDDYELLVAVPVPRYGELAAAADRLDLKLSVIGELRPGNGIVWTLQGREFSPPQHGYDHFRRASTQVTV